MSQGSQQPPSNNSTHCSLVGRELTWVERTERRLAVDIAAAAAAGSSKDVSPSKAQNTEAVPANEEGTASAEATTAEEKREMPPAMPIGVTSWNAIRNEWRKPVGKPIVAAAKMMDPADIIDAIEDTPGDPLDPPVSCVDMIDILTEIWEDEGLYE